MTDIYLAYGGPVKSVLAGWDWDQHPINILVATPYLKQYDRDSACAGYQPANLMLDSGAFSAWKSGKEIDIDALIVESLKPRWTASVGLDVIGSAEGTRKNLDYMQAQGSPAMPVFHIGDPWELLTYYCENWDRVGLSCRFGESVADSMKFYEQCFARTYPHKFHSFGWIAPKMLGEFPFYTADASSWEMAPLAFRQQVRIHNAKLKHQARGPGTQTIVSNLAGSIHHYRQLQDRLKVRWAREMARLEAL